MRVATSLIWLGFLACLVIGVRMHLLQPAPPALRPSAPAISASISVQQSPSQTVEALEALPLAPHADVSLGLQSQRRWQDPSVDPKIWQRAFAPPRSLAQRARSKPLALQPSKREWRTLQQQDGAVAY